MRSDTSTSLCCNLTYLTLEQSRPGHVTVGLNFGTEISQLSLTTVWLKLDHRTVLLLWFMSLIVYNVLSACWEHSLIRRSDLPVCFFPLNPCFVLAEAQANQCMTNYWLEARSWWINGSEATGHSIFEDHSAVSAHYCFFNPLPPAQKMWLFIFVTFYNRLFFLKFIKQVNILFMTCSYILTSHFIMLTAFHTTTVQTSKLWYFPMGGTMGDKG